MNDPDVDPDFARMAELTAMEHGARAVFPLKILGFMSITIVNGKSYTKPLDVFFFLLSVSVGISICVFSFLQRKSLVTSESKVADFGNFMSFISAICVSITSMCVSFVFRHKVWSVLLSLIKVDKKVKNY